MKVKPTTATTATETSSSFTSPDIRTHTGPRPAEYLTENLFIKFSRMGRKEQLRHRYR